MKFFICSYTNKVKSYCDVLFLAHLGQVAKDNPVFIVDNTLDNGEYINRLRSITNKFTFAKTIIPPGKYQFLRNVTFSVNLCREAFLISNCDHMVIVESDVIPPVHLLEAFEKDITYLNNQKENWGTLGALYYSGFHQYNLQGLCKTPNTLSGCTVYNKELIKDTLFRWDINTLYAFPDAFMSLDGIKKGYTNWNDHDLICQHLERTPGDRGHNDPLF